MMNKDEYKELNIRLNKMNNPEWVNSIDLLKHLEYESSKHYFVSYISIGKRKAKKMHFHKVEYFKESNSFKFTELKGFASGGLSEEILNEIELKDFEIEKVEILTPTFVGSV